MRHVRPAYVALAAVAAFVCLSGAIWQSRISYASHLAAGQTSERLARAAEMASGDAAAWRQLGVTLLKQGSSAAGASLRRAVALNPGDAEAWAALGLVAEGQGDAAAAEAAYRKGADLTRRYRPKLALASFYARTGNPEKFWEVAGDAAAVEAAYLGRIFEIAHDIAEDPKAVPGRLRLRSEYSLAGYLSFLIETNRPGSVADISLRLPATEHYRDRLISATERLLRDGDIRGAVAVWSRLAPLVDPGREPFPANPTFLELPPRGFNWRAAKLSGTALIFRSGGGLQIEFTGRQPESGNILAQWLPVEPGSDYRLRVRYATNHIQHSTGLRWTVQQPGSSFDLTDGQAVLEPVAEGVAEARFRAHAQAELLRLTLTYARVPGTVRIEGEVTLHEARVDRVP